jgi:hypothetical protein
VIASVEEEYFRTCGETRDGVIATGETGEYRIGSSDYFARATTAIDSILQLAELSQAATALRGMICVKVENSIVIFRVRGSTHPSMRE